jgi:hypothetical protein
MTKGASQLRIRRLEVRVASGAQQIYCHLRGVACIRTCGKRDEYERSGGLDDLSTPIACRLPPPV